MPFYLMLLTIKKTGNSTYAIVQAANKEEAKHILTKEHGVNGVTIDRVFETTTPIARVE